MTGKCVHTYNVSIQLHRYSCSICIHNWFYLFQLAQLIVNAGGVAAVVDYIGESRGNVRLPGVMMLGYVAAQSENLAMAVITSKVSKQTVWCICMMHTYACVCSIHSHDYSVCCMLYNHLLLQQGVAQLAMTLSEEQEDHILVCFITEKCW